LTKKKKRLKFLNTLTEKSRLIGFFDTSNFAILFKIINFAADYEPEAVQVL